GGDRPWILATTGDTVQGSPASAGEASSADAATSPRPGGYVAMDFLEGDHGAAPATPSCPHRFWPSTPSVIESPSRRVAASRVESGRRVRAALGVPTRHGRGNPVSAPGRPARPGSKTPGAASADPDDL